MGHGQAMQRGIRMCRGCVIGWWRRDCALFGPRVASDCTEFEEGMPHDWNDGADVHRARSEGSFFREAPRHSSCAISSRGRSRRPEIRRPRAQQQHRIQFKAITPPRIAQTTGSTRDKSSLGHMTTDDRDKATSREAAATPHDAAEAAFLTSSSPHPARLASFRAPPSPRCAFCVSTPGTLDPSSSSIDQ